MALAECLRSCATNNEAVTKYSEEDVAVACTVGIDGGKMIARNFPDEILSRENGFIFYAFHKDHSEFFKKDGNIKLPILVCQYQEKQFSFTEKLEGDPSKPDDKWKESFEFNASRKKLHGTIPYIVWRKDHTSGQQWEYQLTKGDDEKPDSQFKYIFHFFAFPANPCVFKKIQYDSIENHS